MMRKDLTIIADLIHDGAKVLDVGCGKGELLTSLAKDKNVDGRGIEISQKGVSSCVKNGLQVIQGDADTDLIYYPDHGFDFVVMSRTLQATQNPKKVLIELLRISKKAIISIPNFGYWYNRYYLGFRGRMPVSKTLSYEWYETPNIHFSTIKDFLILVDELGFKVERKFYIKGDGGFLPPAMRRLSANLLAEYGVFCLRMR